MDYSELVKQLRDSEDWAAKDGGIPVGLIYRLSQAADAIEELQAAVEREKTYTQFWQDAAETCKMQYEKMEKKMLDWQAVADEHWEAYQHWFHNYMNDVPKWIPVTERLPEAGKKVLVFAYGYDTITARMCKKTEYGYPVFECKGYDGIYREMARTGRISHWMPLPEPPKEETE